jgi:hypothetical protein
MKSMLAFVPAVLALAACNDGTQNAEVSDAQATATADDAPADAVGPPTDGPAPDATTAAAIPAAMHGRWGLVPADCTTTMGDDKGLMTVEAQTLRFYESRATLEEVLQSSANSLRGQFAFTGEGMEWQREMSLELAGDTLTRREYGEEASTEPLRYTKCA